MFFQVVWAIIQGLFIYLKLTTHGDWTWSFTFLPTIIFLTYVVVIFVATLAALMFFHRDGRR